MKNIGVNSSCLVPLPLLAPVMTLALVIVLAWCFGLRCNRTPSMPVGLYALRTGQVQRGDMVLFCPPPSVARLGMERGYLRTGSCPAGSQPMLKYVAGLEGDVVSVASSGVSVNATLLPGSALRTHDRQGRPLPTTLRACVIPPDMALLLARHPQSFDGRYFGLVPLAPLRVAIPLYTIDSKELSMIQDEETERLFLSQDYRKKAAAIVEEQARTYPELGIPVDPDIAEHMGAFEDKALSEDAEAVHEV